MPLQGNESSILCLGGTLHSIYSHSYWILLWSLCLEEKKNQWRKHVLSWATGDLLEYNGCLAFYQPVNLWERIYKTKWYMHGRYKKHLADICFLYFPCMYILNCSHTLYVCFRKDTLRKGTHPTLFNTTKILINEQENGVYNIKTRWNVLLRQMLFKCQFSNWGIFP